MVPPCPPPASKPRREFPGESSQQCQLLQVAEGQAGGKAIPASFGRKDSETVDINFHKNIGDKGKERNSMCQEEAHQGKS